MITEYEIKGILLTLEITKGDEDYGEILRAYKDNTSHSKEAKVEAILRSLNYEECKEKLFLFIAELIKANKLSHQAAELINEFLKKDGFQIPNTNLKSQIEMKESLKENNISSNIKLSNEVKGYIADFIAETFSWEKIRTIAMMAGIDQSKTKDFRDKREISRFIVENYSEGKLFLKALLDMSKKGPLNEDYSKQFLSYICPIMMKTMNYTLTEEGNIVFINEVSPFEYDVALSFAGEDRDIARKLFKALESRNVKVFFDEVEKHILWGKNLRDYFSKVYGPKSRYIIPLISKSYPDKDWPDYELYIAKEEAKKREGEFILPVRLDDTKVVGIHGTTGYLDFRKEGIEEIVNTFLEKLKLSKERVSYRNGNLLLKKRIKII